MREGIELGLKFDEALDYAVKKLAIEPSHGGIGVMKRDYQIEQRCTVCRGDHGDHCDA